MAKKKAAKTAKKAAKKKASGASAAPEFNEAELHAAAVVMWGAEGLLGAVEYLQFDINTAANTFPVTVQEVSTTGRTTSERNEWTGLNWARRLLVRRDFADMPYLRVIGRVLDVLLNHRRFQACTSGDVFLVFLTEIQLHLEENHRQSQRPDGTFDVTMQPARRTFNNRMDRLREEELVRATVTRESGREEGYVFTEYGWEIFDGWPDLAEIPGLELQGPVTPDNCARTQSRRRS